MSRIVGSRSIAPRRIPVPVAPQRVYVLPSVVPAVAERIHDKPAVLAGLGDIDSPAATVGAGTRIL